MTEKGAAGLYILVILLLWAAHAAYGYWTDRVGVREEFAVVWPLEMEIETEEENETVNESAAAESGKTDGTEHETGEKGAEDGQPL